LGEQGNMAAENGEKKSRPLAVSTACSESYSQRLPR